MNFKNNFVKIIKIEYAFVLLKVCIDVHIDKVIKCHTWQFYVAFGLAQLCDFLVDEFDDKLLIIC